MAKKKVRQEAGLFIDFIKSRLDQMSEDEIESLLSSEHSDNDHISAEDMDKHDAEVLLRHAMMCDSDDEALILAKRALFADPNCTSAHLFLAELQTDLKVAINHYKSALAIEEKLLGKKNFKRHKGHFWGFRETRPYMITLFEMMMCYKKFGEYGEAIKVCENMLELNSNDNQGIRYTLMPLYLTKRMDENAEELYKKYEDDASTTWEFARALLDYRRNPKSDLARESAEKANKSNPHVLKYILDRNQLPKEPPDSYSFGDDSEAVVFMHESKMLWDDNPEFIDFVRALFSDHLQLAV